jgi:hypothetical protein
MSTSRFDAIRRAIEGADPWLKEAGNAQLVMNLVAGIEAGLDWEESKVFPGAWNAEEALDTVLRYHSELSSWRLRHGDAAKRGEWEVLKERVANILGAWESRRRMR